MEYILYVSPSVNVNELVRLLNNGNVLCFYELKDGLKTATNREYIKGTCHRVLNIGGNPYCVDMVRRLPFGGFEILTNRDNKTEIFNDDTVFEEFPNASEWLFDVWANV